MTTELMWLIGAAGTICLTLLGAIWGEIRSLRKDLIEFSRTQASMHARIDCIENVMDKLPCYRDFVCPNRQ